MEHLTTPDQQLADQRWRHDQLLDHLDSLPVLMGKRPNVATALEGLEVLDRRWLNAVTLVDDRFQSAERMLRKRADDLLAPHTTNIQNFGWWMANSAVYEQLKGLPQEGGAGRVTALVAEAVEDEPPPPGVGSAFVLGVHLLRLASRIAQNTLETADQVDPQPAPM